MACASSATARRTRRPCSTPSSSPTRWSNIGLVDEIRATIALHRVAVDALLLRAEALASALLTPPRSVYPCLPRPTSNTVRSTETPCSRSSAPTSPTFSKIEPSTITEGQSFVDDLDADSLALIELVEALEEDLSERSVGFRIEDEDLVDLKTVRDAVDYVYDRVQEA